MKEIGLKPMLSIEEKQIYEMLRESSNSYNCQIFQEEIPSKKGNDSKTMQKYFSTSNKSVKYPKYSIPRKLHNFEMLRYFLCSVYLLKNYVNDRLKWESLI